MGVDVYWLILWQVLLIWIFGYFLFVVFMFFFPMKIIEIRIRDTQKGFENLNEQEIRFQHWYRHILFLVNPRTHALNTINFVV